MAERADVVVVGGGVTGLGVAFELLRRGRGVRVLERERQGAGAAEAAAGMLAPISEAEIETPSQIVLAQDSLDRFPAFVAEVERHSGQRCDYRTDGTLWVAANRDEQEQLEHLAETLAHKDLPFRALDGDEVRELEPHLTGRVQHGLWVRHDHQVDPRALGCALEAAIAALGGVVEREVAVEAIEAAGGRVSAVRGRGPGDRVREWDCEVVVLCAGPWCDAEGLRLPLPRLGVRPVKGQLLRLRGTTLLRHVVRSPEVYLVPRADGELLVGATMEEMGFDATPTAGAVLDLLRHAWRLLPGIYDLRLAEVSVGLRCAVSDQLPVLGPTPVAGLFVATGHFRSGILLAPATAHYVAVAVTEGRLPAELEPFAPSRLWPRATAGTPGASG